MGLFSQLLSGNSPLGNAFFAKTGLDRNQINKYVNPSFQAGGKITPFYGPSFENGGLLTGTGGPLSTVIPTTVLSPFNQRSNYMRKNGVVINESQQAIKNMRMV